MRQEIFKVIGYLVIFWIMQIIAQIFFKWGSGGKERWLTGFIVGNLFGFSSMWLLMILYKIISPNLALALGAGGAFLLTQLVFYLWLKTSLTLLQWLGIIAITTGMILVTVGR